VQGRQAPARRTQSQSDRHLLAQGKSVLVTARRPRHCEWVRPPHRPGLRPPVREPAGERSGKPEQWKARSAPSPKGCRAPTRFLWSWKRRDWNQNGRHLEEIGGDRKQLARRGRTNTATRHCGQDVAAAVLRGMCEGKRDAGWIPAGRGSAPLPLTPGELADLYRRNTALCARTRSSCGHLQNFTICRGRRSSKLRSTNETVEHEDWSCVRICGKRRSEAARRSWKLGGKFVASS